jgi:hypothetical protein
VASVSYSTRFGQLGASASGANAGVCAGANGRTCSVVLVLVLGLGLLFVLKCLRCGVGFVKFLNAVTSYACEWC